MARRFPAWTNGATTDIVWQNYSVATPRVPIGRQAESSIVLPSGERVGFSLTERPGGYRIRFCLPTGKRVERTSGCSKVGEARLAAAAGNRRTASVPTTCEPEPSRSWPRPPRASTPRHWPWGSIRKPPGTTSMPARHSTARRCSGQPRRDSVPVPPRSWKGRSSSTIVWR